LGISVGVIEFLIQLRRRGYLTPGGAIIELGSQQLGSTCLAQPDRLAQLGQLFGINKPLPLPPQEPWQQDMQGGEHILDPEAPAARDFWRWLGFEYAAIDIDGSEGSIPLDLNYDSVPPEAKGKYNLVTNFGTTEHIANQLNAFKVIHDLTAPNGIMIHEVPTQGMWNHGLINYNFKFFWMLSRSNGYKIIHADFLPSEAPSQFPDNIAEFLTYTRLMGTPKSFDYQAPDAGLLVMMQKSFDIAFVPPLAVDKTSTDLAMLKERYWTVFDPDDLERLRSNGRPGGQNSATPVQAPSTTDAPADRTSGS